MAAVAFFSTLFARLVIGPVVPQITAAFDVSNSEIGLALTGMWLATALVQYPSGVFGDRYGEARVVLLALGLTVVGCLALAVSSTFFTFSLVVILIGLGSGMYIPSATSLLTRYFENTGQALGIHISGANLAGVIAPVAAAFLAVRYGWQAAPALAGLIVAAAFVLFWWGIEPIDAVQQDRSLRSLFNLGRGVEIFLRPPILFSAFIGTVGAFTFQSIASFLPTFLVEHWAFTISEAGILFGVVYLLSATCLPLMGRFSDWVGRDVGLILSYALLASGFLVLFVGPTPVVAVVGCVLVGSGISWGGVIQSRYMDYLGEGERGTGFGIIRTVTGIVGAAGSVVTGTLADTLGWVSAYGFVVLLLAIAILSLVVVNVRGLDV